MDPNRANRFQKIFRVAVMCCFVAHGWLALKNSNIYYSEWSQWVQSLFSEEEKFWGSQILLGSVGTIDILVGLSFVFVFLQPPLFAIVWAICWGSLTALSRLYFLGSFTPPFWSNVVYPLSEFLVRSANWIVPLLAVSQLEFSSTPRWVERILSRISSSTRPLIYFVIITQVFGIFLHYLVELNHELYPYEIHKKSMPIWYFHAIGSTSVCALTFAFLNFKWPNQSTLRIVAIYLSVISFLLAEGFEIVILNSSHGFSYTAIRIAEHVPIYSCFAYLLWAQLPRPCPGSRIKS